MIREYGEIILIVFAVIGSIYGGIEIVWPRLKSGSQWIVDIGQAMTMLPQAVTSLHHLHVMQSTLTSVHLEVKQITADVAIVSATMRANADADPEKGMFECDDAGHNIWVNKTYCHWLNCTEDELLGRRFLGRIPSDIRESVRAEWDSCLREHRQYNSCHEMVLEDGTSAGLFDFTATPIPPGAKPQRWIGVIRRVN